jgi:hypothetical protein
MSSGLILPLLRRRDPPHVRLWHERLLEVGQSMSALPRYFRHQPVPLLPMRAALVGPIANLNVALFSESNADAVVELRLRLRQFPSVAARSGP